MIQNKSSSKKNELLHEKQVQFLNQALQSASGDNRQNNDKDSQTNLVHTKAKQPDSKNSNLSQMQQQLRILEELILNDKGEKIIYKMRPSKVIQQKCYRIVDLRQQRLKVLSNTKENSHHDQQQNTHSAKNYKNHNSNSDKLQTPTQNKNIFQQTQNLQSLDKRGTSIAGVSTNLSNVTTTPTALMGNSNLFTDYDSKNHQASIFQFQMDKGILNDAGISSQRNQFIFSEKYMKNLTNKRISMTREKQRIKNKGSYSYNMNNPHQYQATEGDFNQTNQVTTTNGKRRVYAGGSETAISSVRNNQTYVISDPTHRIKKQQSYLNDDSLVNKLNNQHVRGASKDEQEGVQRVQNKNNQQNIQSSKIERYNALQSKQSITQCSHRRELPYMNQFSTTSQGFYNTNSTEKCINQQASSIYPQPTQSQFQQSYYQQFQNIKNVVSEQKREDQEYTNYNISNFDTSKSVLFQQLSNVIYFNQSTKKLNQSGINFHQSDLLASSFKKPIRSHSKNAMTTSNIQRPTTKLDKEQYEKQLQQFNEEKDLTTNILQNRNLPLRGCTSENSRKGRKASSNIEALQQHQQQSQQTKVLFDELQKSQNMIVLNLSSRPQTASNLLVQNKIFRDETLNSNLFKMQKRSFVKQSTNNFNDIGVCLDLDSTIQNNNSQIKNSDNYPTSESIILQNSAINNNSNNNDNNKDANNLKEESKFETLKTYSKLLQQNINKKNSQERMQQQSDVFILNQQSTQLKGEQRQNNQSQKKQIDNLIGQMFKKSFFPHQRYPQISQQLNISQNEQQKNKVISKQQISQPNFTQQQDINKQILYSNVTKSMRQKIQQQGSNQQLEDCEEQIQLYNADEEQQQQNQQVIYIQDSYDCEEEEPEITQQNNQLVDEQYQQLNQYYHQKYTNFQYLPDNKPKQQFNQFFKTHSSFNSANNKQQQQQQQQQQQYNHDKNDIISNLAYYDKFEPWENDDHTLQYEDNV